jgi:hypothetical protein
MKEEGHGHVVFGVDVGCAWERHAPAWLLEPGWSPALPGKPGSLLALDRQLHDSGEREGQREKSGTVKSPRRGVVRW